MHLKVFESKLHKNPNTAEPDKFIKPDSAQVVDMRPETVYNKLGSDGMVNEETILEPNDAIIGKVTSMITPDQQGRTSKDASTCVRESEIGTVDKVMQYKDQDGYNVAKVRIRQIREPIVGDKFCSRHGQKGVIGIAYRQEDMPFTESGMIPDMIMNPHAWPSRMTIGQFAEMITAKIAAMEGVQYDGTAHEPVDFENMKDTLEKLGFSRSGKETMYCGLTGRKMETDIFVAPVYMHRLKHMVADKCHARALGPQQILTRQPVEGRARDGGLRLGTMEKDNLLSHGIVGMLKERLMDCSDATEFNICDICGQIATKMRSRNIYYCQPCDNYTNITPVVIPYALKLLQQNLGGLHIKMNFRTENSVNH
tara:strand:+ start:14 stop:1114 length:1101 start_codon:yes stop_codon:yes gene_type:complete